MDYQMILNGEEFLILCEEFKTQVYANKYRKVEYRAWKNMMSLGKDEKIEIIFHEDYLNTGNKVIFIEIFTGLYDFYFDTLEEDSFGSFLKEHLFYKNSVKNSCENLKKLGSALKPIDLSAVNQAMDSLNNILNKKSNAEENKNMLKMKNFDFGPVNKTIKMSMYGVTILNKEGQYVAYDKESGELMDVDAFNFDGSQFLYRMPVAIKDIAVGDIVMHSCVPMFVTKVAADEKTLTVIDPVAGERKEILLTRSPFGFNFATKVVNLLDGMFKGVNPTESNPFGNMWMLMLLDDENKNMSDMLLPMMMAQSNGKMDPMMMMLLMKDNKEVSPLLYMMAFQNMNGAGDVKSPVSEK